MAQADKARIQKIFNEAYNKGDLDVLDDIIAADYKRHQPPMKDVKGLAAYKEFIRNVRSAYTGFEMVIDDIIAEGETCVTRTVLKGKHTGQAPTLQAPPTGKDISMPGCTVSYWKDGKIIEEWVYNDYLGLVQQFGVIPLPGLFA